MVIAECRSILRTTWSLPVMILTSATGCLSDLQKPPSDTEHHARPLKHKIGSYVRYLRNFDRPLGLPVIPGDVSDVGNVSSLKKTTA